MYKFSLFLLITIFWINSFSQKKFYSDSVYNNDIRTVQIVTENSPFSYPIIDLNSDQTLNLSFDDLNIDNKSSNYQYTFIHCNSDWSVSELSFNDFADGFEENPITDYSSSFNTLVNYVHFNIQFPNNDVEFKLSGNYIIVVYEDYDPQKIILTKKFYISENNATVSGNVHIPSINMYKQNYQQIDFTVSSNLFSIGNPMTYTKIIISQNNRPDKIIANLKPSFIKSNQLVFDDPQQNIILGGNEYRFFDTKNIHFAPEKVVKIQLNELYNFFLLPEPEYSKYFFHKEIDGRFYIANDNGTNANDDADYVYVHFYLMRDYPFLEDVYIIGQFTNWQYLPEYKMTYDKDHKIYYANILMKQGYYNYSFATKNQGLFPIDGNYSETKNTYLIYVYFKDILMNYDKLLAIKILNN